MPMRPPKHDPHAWMKGRNIPVHKPASRQQGRFLHTGSKQWRTIREVQLQRFPLCEDCEAIGVSTPATEADHNTNDTSRNMVGVELSSLCKPCHSTRTARRERGLPTVYGCDVDGLPLDPNHPWRREKSLEGSS